MSKLTEVWEKVQDHWLRCVLSQIIMSLFEGKMGKQKASLHNLRSQEPTKKHSEEK